MKIYNTNIELIADIETALTLKKAVEFCVLSSANLSRADLSDANLSDANLKSTDLSGTDLSGTDLSGANLIGANLCGANLCGADLQRADFHSANLSGADLSGVNLIGAKGIYCFNKSGGRTCYAIQYETFLMIKAGCWWGTLIEFEERCKAVYPNNAIDAYTAQIAYLKTL